MAERVIDVNLEQQAREDLQSYAIYVARARAIPDAIDGLKPVVRRVLWCAAHDFGNQGFVKTASVVGKVMEKYNPHGDSGVNTAIRNMINDFSTKYPTMDGSGSWGTKVDPYAAQPRYNECRMSKFAQDVFIQDIRDDKRSTDWMHNYDNKFFEPVFLPAKIPVALINGQMGIGVGIKTNIPSHNLGDVIDVTINLMKDPNYKFRLIPDECMPCEIMDTDWDSINETGTGTYIAQGIIDIGDYNGKPCLIVHSLPDFTFYDKIDEKIRALAKDGRMPYISDVISRSGVDKHNPKNYKFEEVIVLKKGTDPNFVKEFLYANTGIRQTRQVSLIFIKNNNLATMGYRDYLLNFISFRRMIVFRKLNAKLQTIKTWLHETELYIKLLTSGHIDDVIHMIRKSKSADRSELVEFLIKKLRVTPIQAKFLAKITLPELSEGFLRKCQADRAEYEKESKHILSILLDPKKIDQVIIDDMLAIKEKYNDKKKCWIVSKNQIKGIAPGTFKLVIFSNNFIKKINENDTVPPSQLPKVRLVVMADNAEDLILFSSFGKAFKIPIHKIPLSDSASEGTDVRLLNKYCTTNIMGVATESVLKYLANNKKNFIFVVTRAGYIKKIDIQDVVNTPPSGLIYSKVEQGDNVQALLFGPDKMDVLFYTKQKVIRLANKDIPYLRRSTKGNLVSFSNNVSIEGMSFLLPQSTDLVVLTKNGFVNRVQINAIERVARGRAGTGVIKLTKGDEIHKIWNCTPEFKLVCREGRGQKEIPISQIPYESTVSPGKKLVNDAMKTVLMK